MRASWLLLVLGCCCCMLSALAQNATTDETTIATNETTTTTTTTEEPTHHEDADADALLPPCSVGWHRSLHGVAMGLTFSVILPLGIMLHRYYGCNSRIHGAIQSIGLLLVLLGFICIWYHEEQTNCTLADGTTASNSSATTDHGHRRRRHGGEEHGGGEGGAESPHNHAADVHQRLGIAVFVFLVAQIIIGVTHLMLPTVPLRVVHRFFALVVLALGVTACYLGLDLPSIPMQWTYAFTVPLVMFYSAIVFLEIRPPARARTGTAKLQSTTAIEDPLKSQPSTDTIPLAMLGASTETQVGEV